jgi:hypothetical protein
VVYSPLKRTATLSAVQSRADNCNYATELTPSCSDVSSLLTSLVTSHVSHDTNNISRPVGGGNRCLCRSLSPSPACFGCGRCASAGPRSNRSPATRFHAHFPVGCGGCGSVQGERLGLIFDRGVARSASAFFRRRTLRLFAGRKMTEIHFLRSVKQRLVSDFALVVLPLPHLADFRVTAGCHLIIV